MLTFGLVNHALKAMDYQLDLHWICNQLQRGCWHHWQLNLGEVEPIIGMGFCCRNKGAGSTYLKCIRPSQTSHSGNWYGTGLLRDPDPYGISDTDQAGYPRALYLDILINWSPTHLWTWYWKFNRTVYVRRDSTSKNCREQKYKVKEDFNNSHFYIWESLKNSKVAGCSE